MGRPKKLDRRDRQLNIHLTGGEFKTITSRASTYGMQPVDYGRWMLLDQGDRTALPAPEVSRFDRLVHLQLQKLGTLLNQPFRHLHQTGNILPDLEPLLREIRSLLNRNLP